MAACRFSCPALRVRARTAPAPAAPSAAAVTYCSFFSIKSRPFLLWWVSCPQLTTPDGPPPCTKTARGTKTVHRACFVRLQAFSGSQKRHAPGGTHFCLLRRTEIPSPGYHPGHKNERCTDHSAFRPRTLSALNFPVCVPSIRTCRLDGTFLTV